MREAGAVLAVGGGTAYATVELTEVLAEVLDFVPIVGWLASGFLTVPVTTSVGGSGAGPVMPPPATGRRRATEIRLPMA